MVHRGWSLLGPLQWITYINKEVRVKAGKDEEHRGFLFTVDPVSASLVLVDFRSGGRALVQVVMGHSVQEVHILKEPDPETTAQLQSAFLPPPPHSLNPEVQTATRRRVRSWLEKNRIPVEEEGAELLVAGILTISAPYGPEHCQSSNQIILDRIQRLIQNLPEADPELLQAVPEPTRD